MNEYRRSLRKTPFTNTPVNNMMTGEVLGRIGNLSSDGMLMVCESEIASDALFQLGFELDDDHNKAHAINVGVQQMWSEPANVPGQFWAGFHFIDISDADLSAIESWIGNNED
ncbi:MAG TPA: PilZ domain-containing protein [Dokdonella sp.]|uniref:PilZ domain-containing protein n=1 Tax=Dokdonella sp. TaxID=2291710 RepID=UPI002D80B65C|nr:PilZ domain-containing protein [Dokdonella sp.]HET9034290.1 PilZ domain-containing protein [Dokdonella sp.]